MFVAIVETTPDGRVAKYQDYATLAEAQAHVNRVKGQYPNAFAAPRPGAGFFDWKVNPSGKTISVDPRAKPAPVEGKSIQAIRRIADELSPTAKNAVLAILDGN